MTGNRARGIALATLTAVVWGTVPIGGKIAVRGVSAPYLSSIRLLSAAVVLLAVLAIRGRLPKTPPSREIVFASLGLAANYVLYMFGLERSGTATTQVLIQTAPLFLILLSVLVLGERPSAGQIVGFGLAAVGVTSVTWGQGSLDAPPLGVTLILLSALAWALYGVFHKRIGATQDATTSMMWIFLISGLATLPSALADARFDPTGPQTLAVVYMCGNTIVAYWAFAEALRHIPASLASVLATLGPVVTFSLVAAAGRLGIDGFPHESISIEKVLGAGAVIAGVILAVTSSRGGADRPDSPSRAPAD